MLDQHTQTHTYTGCYKLLPQFPLSSFSPNGYIRSRLGIVTFAVCTPCLGPWPTVPCLLPAEALISLPAHTTLTSQSRDRPPSLLPNKLTPRHMAVTIRHSCQLFSPTTCESLAFNLSVGKKTDIYDCSVRHTTAPVYGTFIYLLKIKF